jgi:hypothetical protein
MKIKLDENLPLRAAQRLRALDDREQPHIANFLDAWFSKERVETWAGALVVASPRKIRVMRPEPED